MDRSSTKQQEAHVDWDSLVSFLSRHSAYPHRPSRVELIETHLSCVFLTDRFVFKLKKPVHYEFVDFRTLPARRTACEDEVRLNRRLAPDVYLGVVPVTMPAPGRLQLEGRGPVVEYLVKMRRLPEARMLDRLIRSGKLRDDEVRRLAKFLAEVYDRAPPLVLLPQEYRSQFEAHVRANRAELLRSEHGLDAHAVQRVHTAQLLYVQLAAATLTDRVCDGRIIDGHGDLRPEHVCLEARPVVFDCLEFSAELRRLDVLDELSFFAMECDFLGAEHVGRQVLDAYLQRSGEEADECLMLFYKAYRACVRAKVAVLRARQLDSSERLTSDARRHLELADCYARKLAAPVLLIVRGTMGAGKTTLARRLAEMLGAQRLGTDEIRRALFGASRQPAEFNGGNYTPQARAAVYDELSARGRDLLRSGRSAILDGSFLSRQRVEEALQMAAETGGVAAVVTCRCPDDVARQRIAQRRAHEGEPSEARPELLEPQTAAMDAVSGDAAVEVDSTRSLVAQAAEVLKHLERLMPMQPATRAR